MSRWPFLLALFCCASEPAAAEWTLEAAGGVPWNFTTPLTIRQQDFEELRVDARYRSRPFDTPPYYLARLARRTSTGAWELQLLHHKLVLDNRPPDIQRFEVTHGYNIITLHRSRAHRGWSLRAGAGVVLAHPESTVRDRRFGPRKGVFGLDQYLTGPAAIVGVGRDWRLGQRILVNGQFLLSAARAHVPVRDGDASVPNVALHFVVGVGVGL